jgi:hypothetical protein
VYVFVYGLLFGICSVSINTIRLPMTLVRNPAGQWSLWQVSPASQSLDYLAGEREGNGSV